MTNKQWYERGMQAFEEGKSSFPLQDEKVADFVNKCKVGEARKPMQNWVKGWNNASSKSI